MLPIYYVPYLVSLNHFNHLWIFFTEEPRTDDADGDTEMPSADDLEDWEQSVDEILNDEQNCEGTQYAYFTSAAIICSLISSTVT